MTVDARRRFELLEDCRDMVISRLTHVIGEALDGINEELTASALKETRREAQQVLLDAVSLVRVHRSDLELRFRQSFSQVFERRMFDRAEPSQALATSGELALVADDAIESRIAVDRMVQRARGKLDPDEVLGMRVRFAALLDREWFEENEHPAAPEAVFEALRHALDELAPAAPVRSALLQAFEPHVSASLNAVYSSVNERLRSNQILPTIKPRVQISRDGARGDRGHVPSARMGSQMDSNADSNAGMDGASSRTPDPGGEARGLAGGNASSGGDGMSGGFSAGGGRGDGSGGAGYDGGGFGGGGFGGGGFGGVGPAGEAASGGDGSGGSGFGGSGFGGGFGTGGAGGTGSREASDGASTAHSGGGWRGGSGGWSFGSEGSGAMPPGTDVPGPGRSEGGGSSGTGFAAGGFSGGGFFGGGLPGSGGGSGTAGHGGGAHGGDHSSSGPAAAAVRTPDNGPGLEVCTDLIQQISAGRPSARRSAARMLSDPTTFGVADLPMPSVEPPLIEALHTMQAVAPADGAQLATRLLDHARDKGSPLDQLTVEIVSLVFDYIYADRRLPDVVKQELLRLQVVAVKAALIDRSFFARRQHPMRQFIDRISELATDPDADLSIDSTLATGIAGIVDWIIEHFDNDLSTFEEAMQRLDALAQAEGARRATRVLELTHEAEYLEALTIAQEEARAEIALRIDAVTPAFVREFLHRWWSRTLAHVRAGADDAAADWDETMHVGELLIWSVAPKSPEDIIKLASLLPKLIGGLTRGLQAVGIEQSERESFFNELLQWHTRSIQDAKHNGAERPRSSATSPVRMSADGRVRFEARKPERVAADDAPAGPRLHMPPSHTSPAGIERGSQTPPQPAVPRQPVALPPMSAGEARVDALARGDLVEIVEADEGPRTLKLAWISPTRKLYVLTRFPDVGRPLSRGELVGLFDSGRARRVDPESALDRAIDAIAQPDAA